MRIVRWTYRPRLVSDGRDRRDDEIKEVLGQEERSQERRSVALAVHHVERPRFSVVVTGKSGRDTGVILHEVELTTWR